MAFLSFSLIASLSLKGVDGAGKRSLLRATTDRCREQKAIFALQGTSSTVSKTRRHIRESRRASGRAGRAEPHRTGRL